MTIFSEDRKVYADIGNYSYWNCFYSTIVVKLKKLKKEILQALSFLENVECKPIDCIETARQLNLIRDNLSKISPKELVYDLNDLSKRPPWEGNISPVVTSCGNFFTTADGKDLIYELNVVLCYCAINDMSVTCEE